MTSRSRADSRPTAPRVPAQHRQRPRCLPRRRTPAPRERRRAGRAAGAADGPVRSSRPSDGTGARTASRIRVALDRGSCSRRRRRPPRGRRGSSRSCWRRDRPSRRRSAGVARTRGESSSSRASSSVRRLGPGGDPQREQQRGDGGVARDRDLVGGDRDRHPGGDQRPAEHRDGADAGSDEHRHRRPGQPVVEVGAAQHVGDGRRLVGDRAEQPDLGRAAGRRPA